MLFSYFFLPIWNVNWGFVWIVYFFRGNYYCVRAYKLFGDSGIEGQYQLAYAKVQSALTRNYYLPRYFVTYTPNFPLSSPTQYLNSRYKAETRESIRFSFPTLLYASQNVKRNKNNKRDKTFERKHRLFGAGITHLEPGLFKILLEKQSKFANSLTVYIYIVFKTYFCKLSRGCRVAV